MHKTGTCSVQRVLHDNRALLLEHGILYPSAGVAPHHNFMLDAKQRDFNASRLSEIVDQARQSEIKTLLFSAECVSVLPRDALRRLTACFAPSDSLSFVVSLRHWSSFLPSRYAQNCKRRDAQTYADYLRRASEPSRQHLDFYYDVVLENLSETAHSVKIISFDRAVQEDGLVAAVLRAAGLPEALRKKLKEPVEHANQSPPWQRVELLRLLNGAASARLGVPENALFNAIAEGSGCDVIFDFDKRLGRLNADHVAAAQEWLNTQAEAAPPVPAEHIHVEARVLNAFAAQVVNLLDGRLFPVTLLARSARPVTTVTWREFQAWNPAIASDMLDTLLKPAPASTWPSARKKPLRTGRGFLRRLRSRIAKA